MNFSIPLKDIERQLEKKADEMKKDVIWASVKALNVVAQRELRSQVKAITDQTKATQKDIKKGIKTEKATKFRPVVTWIFSGYRYPVARPTAVMRKGKQAGVRYLDDNFRRVTKTDYFKEGATKPFIITGINSARKTAVYRAAGSERKVTTIMGHSRQHVVENISFPAARENIRKNFHAEYRNQLKRSKYARARRK